MYQNYSFKTTTDRKYTYIHLFQGTKSVIFLSAPKRPCDSPAWLIQFDRPFVQCPHFLCWLRIAGWSWVPGKHHGASRPAPPRPPDLDLSDYPEVRPSLPASGYCISQMEWIFILRVDGCNQVGNQSRHKIGMESSLFYFRFKLIFWSELRISFIGISMIQRRECTH